MSDHADATDYTEVEKSGMVQNVETIARLEAENAELSRKLVEKQESLIKLSALWNAAENERNHAREQVRALRGVLGRVLALVYRDYNAAYDLAADIKAEILGGFTAVAALKEE